jgi:CheY-like chemotaxis protein
MIDRQSLTLVRLVDDLMDVGRIAHGKLQLRRQPVLLATIMEQALDVVRPLCDQSCVQLLVSPPEEQLMVDADPVRLTQVFSNLLNNACKYTERDGHIWLSVKREGDSACLMVRDDGIGISPHQLPHIFDMFVQDTPGLARSQGGLGIGLALARSLVQAHGGSIEARSEGLGKGSEFIVLVPVVRADASPIDPGPVAHCPPAAGAGQRVLVVEDNVDGASSFASLLRLKGFDVEMVGDGGAALTSAATLTPHIVLLDLGLPGMNGFEVCRALRARPGGEHITIVAISGWGQEGDRHNSAAAGFDAHLVKPVDIGDLLAVLRPSPHPA